MHRAWPWLWRALLLLGLAAAPLAAAAQDLPDHRRLIGLDAGLALSEGGCPEGSGDLHCDGRSAAGQVRAGYRLDSGLWLELNWLQLGDLQVQVAGVPGTLSTHGPGLALGLQGRLAPEWTLHGRLGVALLQTRASAALAAAAGRERETARRLLAGLGLRHPVDGHLNWDLGIDLAGHHYRGNSFDVQILRAGLSWVF